MSEDPVVVETRANVRLTNSAGRTVDLAPGEHAVAHALVEANLRASPRVRLLDRPPSKEEIQAARDRGVLDAPPAEAEDTREVDELLKPELIEMAERLGLDASGSKGDMLDRINELASDRGVTAEGRSARELTDALLEAGGETG